MEEIQVYGPFISRKLAKEQGLKHYFTGKPCKHGHISKRKVVESKCAECELNRLRKWKEDNPERNAQANIKSTIRWREGNPDKVEEYLEKNREKFKQNAREYRTLNPEKAKEASKKSTEKWKRENPELHRITSRNRTRINLLIRSARLPKEVSFSSSIGCNAHQFKAHIESQFKDDMSWDNFDQIEIDHIRPISSFSDLINNKDQRKICFNYRNIQPLWMKDNRAKSDDYTPLDELAWMERMQALGYEGELFLKYEEGNSY
jgi:hypothetical protein